MFTVPLDILNVLKCVYCNKLPTKAPIYQKANDDLVCAECLNFIPIDTKTWMRQKTLELLLPHIKLQKLSSRLSSALTSETTPLLEETNIDLQSASSSSLTNSDPVPVPVLVPAHNIQSKDLKVNISCSLKGNKTTKKATVLQYSMTIQKQTTKQLCLVDDSFLKRFHREIKPVNIYIEGAIALTKKPKQVYGNMEVIPVNVNYPIYESLPSLRSSIKFQPINNNVIEDPKTICQNGCLWRGSYCDLGEHLKICSMTGIYCWFERCTWKGSEQLMKGHLYNKHASYLLDSISGRMTKVDQFMIVIKGGIIFLFKYFYYEDYVEFLVQGVVNRDEIDYKFTVQVCWKDNKGHNLKMFKSAKCLIYNKCVLQKGVIFDKKEFTKLENFNYSVDIVNLF